MAVQMLVPSPKGRRRQELGSLQSGLYNPISTLASRGHHVYINANDTSDNQVVLIERVGTISDTETENALALRKSVMNINHENIARCINIFTEDNALYTVSAPGEGNLLENYASRFDQKTAASYGIQLCNAINYLNKHHDFKNHGYISPTSVYITTGGRAKLANLASFLNVHAPTLSDISQEGSRADVFGICAVAAFMLTGKDFTDPKTSPVIDGVSPEFAAALLKGMEKDPSLRYANCEELRQKLLQFQ